MTVVPATADTSVLICDRCGTQDQAAGVIDDSELVWPLVASVGWTGSPFATGPHSCPRCADVVSEPVTPVHELPAPAHGASYDLQVHHDIDAVVVTPLVDIDAGVAETFRDGLQTAADTCRHIVLDLHAVHLIDSAGLGLLVRARQEAKHNGGLLHLVAPSRFILTVLHTMRLDAIFPTHPDKESAFRAVSLDAGPAPAQAAESGGRAAGIGSGSGGDRPTPREPVMGLIPVGEKRKDGVESRDGQGTPYRR
ncbi:anti-sigma factor antagonist [Solwaraspora sp. WMMD1047]|uniref:anti-sigma factor antagonist n=1 Tax=Solwaraspora sp. WMMD1047 TaxID=3016102 RepID=UPI002417C836|nr:anti-sigma factor antagonist [Solwaraspora sp. WMMD1047]MDG4831730.1 anti-sigma factor antagonist [Solwaraspora sp. WMMD1047]